MRDGGSEFARCNHEISLIPGAHGGCAMTDYPEICELHSIVIPKGHTCPSCQRTDQVLLAIWRELQKLAKQVREIRSQSTIEVAPEGFQWVHMPNPTHDRSCKCNSCRPYLIANDSPQAIALNELKEKK